MSICLVVRCTKCKVDEKDFPGVLWHGDKVLPVALFSVVHYIYQQITENIENVLPHEQKPHTPICLHVLRLTTLLVRRRHPQIKRVLWIHWPSFSYISRGSTWILHLDEVAGCHVKTYSMFDKTNWHCSIHLRKKDDFDRLFGWAVPIKIDGFLNPMWNGKLLDLYCYVDVKI